MKKILFLTFFLISCTVEEAQITYHIGLPCQKEIDSYVSSINETNSKLSIFNSDSENRDIILKSQTSLSDSNDVLFNCTFNTHSTDRNKYSDAQRKSSKYIQSTITSVVSANEVFLNRDDIQSIDIKYIQNSYESSIKRLNKFVHRT